MFQWQRGGGPLPSISITFDSDLLEIIEEDLAKKWNMSRSRVVNTIVRIYLAERGYFWLLKGEVDEATHKKRAGRRA
jgi:metal-responsive CopG/Arc/MetJ family transcriptional regulator